MSFANPFNCKQGEEDEFLRHVILDRIAGSNLTNEGWNGIRVCWVNLFKKLVSGAGAIYSGLKSRCRCSMLRHKD